MRASDLMGKEVHCRDATVGRVIDLRLDTGIGAARGNRAEPAESTALRLDGLVVSAAHVGSTIGYDRRSAGRPWLLWWLVRRLHRKDRYVPWTQVSDWSGEVVEVDAVAADLRGVPTLPE